MAIANGLSERPIKKILNNNLCTWFLPKISKKGFSQVLFGNAEIGNSSLKNSNGKTPIRFFMGRIDELSIFGRALDQDNINKIYQIGKPN